MSSYSHWCLSTEAYSWHVQSTSYFCLALSGSIPWWPRVPPTFLFNDSYSLDTSCSLPSAGIIQPMQSACCKVGESLCNGSCTEFATSPSLKMWFFTRCLSACCTNIWMGSWTTEVLFGQVACLTLLILYQEVHGLTMNWNETGQPRIWATLTKYIKTPLVTHSLAPSPVPSPTSIVMTYVLPYPNDVRSVHVAVHCITDRSLVPSNTVSSLICTCRCGRTLTVWLAAVNYCIAIMSHFPTDSHHACNLLTDGR